MAKENGKLAQPKDGVGVEVLQTPAGPMVGLRVGARVHIIDPPNAHTLGVAVAQAAMLCSIQAIQALAKEKSAIEIVPAQRGLRGDSS